MPKFMKFMFFLWDKYNPDSITSNLLIGIIINDLYFVFFILRSLQKLLYLLDMGDILNLACNCPGNHGLIRRICYRPASCAVCLVGQKEYAIVYSCSCSQCKVLPWEKYNVCRFCIIPGYDRLTGDENDCEHGHGLRKYPINKSALCLYL